MNQERILELAKQADPDHWHSRWCSGINPRVMDPEIKKLAELIVRECAGLCNEIGEYGEYPESEAEACAEYILKHFGVQ